MKRIVSAVIRWFSGGVRLLLKPVRSLRRRWRLALGAGSVVMFALVVLGLWWSEPPATYPVSALTDEQARQFDLARASDLPGLAVTTTLAETTSVLLNKPGGFLLNDRLPPGVWLDNMPNWELGVLWHIRDTLHVLRQDISRADAQAAENSDLVMAEPQLNFTSSRWLMPAPENEYRKGLAGLERYMASLAAGDAEFYVRLDDLDTLLQQADERLERLTEGLLSSASRRLSTLDRAPLVQLSVNAEQASPTPRLEVDDVFYQARGYSWALLHTLQGVALDYGDKLPPDAQSMLDGAVRELAAVQRPIWSPMILNSDGFGLLTNHSMVAAGHMGRAHQQLSELQLMIAAQ